MSSVSPFRIDVPDEVLDDLRDRVIRTRFTTASDRGPWTAGVDPTYLRGLMAHWADGFDWRAVEAELNWFPQFRADLDGQRVHFVHVRAASGTDRLPLVLSHDWPSSFVEMLPLIPLLTDPARHGGDPADAFDVVIPSLPGFGYSGLADGPLTRPAIAETLHALMTDCLGYARYGAYGSDIGAATTSWLGALHPEHVAGIHVIHPSFPAAFDGPPMTEAERAFVAAEETYDEKDGGYSAIMITRPDTIAAALQDSPAGLAAWIVDKFRDWSDCDGDLGRRFTPDDLLTNITLYWVTGTIGTSCRQYYDWSHNPPRPVVTVPAGVTLSAEPSIRALPRSIAERSYADLRVWHEPTVGGHFMAAEEPEMLAANLRSFFRPLR